MFFMSECSCLFSQQEAWGQGELRPISGLSPRWPSPDWPPSKKAPVKVRGTGVPSLREGVPSPWQLHRAAATCLLGQPHMKREALCNLTGITSANNAPVKERQKLCIKRRWGGARLWSPATTNTDSNATYHLPKRHLLPQSSFWPLISGIWPFISAFLFICIAAWGGTAGLSDLIAPGESREDPRGMKGACLRACILSCKHTHIHNILKIGRELSLVRRVKLSFRK